MVIWLCAQVPLVSVASPASPPHGRGAAPASRLPPALPAIPADHVPTAGRPGAQERSDIGRQYMLTSSLILLTRKVRHRSSVHVDIKSDQIDKKGQT